MGIPEKFIYGLLAGALFATGIILGVYWKTPVTPRVDESVASTSSPSRTSAELLRNSIPIISSPVPRSELRPDDLDLSTTLFNDDDVRHQIVAGMFPSEKYVTVLPALRITENGEEAYVCNAVSRELTELGIDKTIDAACFKALRSLQDKLLPMRTVH